MAYSLKIPQLKDNPYGIYKILSIILKPLEIFISGLSGNGRFNLRGYFSVGKNRVVGGNLRDLGLLFFELGAEVAPFVGEAA